jgi:nickel and cobalt resistance protein CnrR
VSAYWRNLAITVVVALAAGWAGGALGVRTLAPVEEMLPLRQSVSAIVRNDLRLSDEQMHELQNIENRYYDRRIQLRSHVAEANRELADALMNDMAFGREAQQASQHVERGLGDLQRATIVYVLEVRDVLTPEQQVVYDRKVREVLTASVGTTSP